MINFVQPGDSIEYSNSGSAIASGAAVVIGNRIGVAVSDIAPTTGKGTVNLSGVYTLAKDGDEAFAVGDALFYDSSDATLTKTATGNKWAGMAFAVAAEAATSCQVMLMPMPKQAALVAALAGTLTGTVDGTLADVAAVSTAGGNTYADSAINTAITSVNLQLKELQTKLNEVIAAQKAAGLMLNA